MDKAHAFATGQSKQSKTSPASSGHKKSCLARKPASRGRRVRFSSDTFPNRSSFSIVELARRPLAMAPEKPFSLLSLLDEDDLPPRRPIQALTPLRLQRRPIHLPPLGLDVQKLRAERQAMFGHFDPKRSYEPMSASQLEDDESQTSSEATYVNTPVTPATDEHTESHGVTFGRSGSTRADSEGGDLEVESEVRFKMTRSPKEIQASRELLEDGLIVKFKRTRSLSGIRKVREPAEDDISNATQAEENTNTASQETQAINSLRKEANGQFPTGHLKSAGKAEEDDQAVMNSASDFNDVQENAEKVTSRSKQIDVFHPWAVVDYHLYLISVEAGKDQLRRRNSMYLFDGNECRPVGYEELFDEDTFDPLFVGETPKLIFNILPIAEPGPMFKGKCYILGFDYWSNTLFARSFKWIPEDIEDIWQVWEEGYNVYSSNVSDTRRMLYTAFSFENGRYGLGMISHDHNCISRNAREEPGLEIVTAILFGQWIVDFVDAFSKDVRDQLAESKEELELFLDDCRLLLQRASYRAWFAVREGMTKGEYRTKASRDQFINELYTFNLDDPALKTGSWRAPSAQTCDRIREQHRQHNRVPRGEDAETRFAKIFDAPQADTPRESPTKNLRRMLAGNSDVPTTPPPIIPPTRPAISRNDSSASSNIVTPAIELFDTPLTTDFMTVPLVNIMKNATELLMHQPELDTRHNRARFGALLAQMGIRRKQKHSVPNDEEEEQGDRCDGDDGDWDFEVNDEETPNAQEDSPALLPSPLYLH